MESCATPFSENLDVKQVSTIGLCQTLRLSHEPPKEIIIPAGYLASVSKEKDGSSRITIKKNHVIPAGALCIVYDDKFPQRAIVAKLLVEYVDGSTRYPADTAVCSFEKAIQISDLNEYVEFLKQADENSK